MPIERSPPRTRGDTRKRMISLTDLSADDGTNTASDAINDDSFQTIILQKLNNLEDVLLETENKLKTIITENSEIKNELSLIKSICEKQNNELNQLREIKQTKSSYADQVKSNVVIVKPIDDNQSSSKTKEIFKEKVNPIENKVSGIRKAAKGSIIIECTNKQQSEKLKSSVAESLGEKYKVEIPKKRYPKFRLCGMSDKLTEEQIINYLIKQNECLKSESELKVIKTTERIDKFKNKNYQAIIETNPESFQRIMQAEKVYVNWDSCKVFEYVNIVRCFKCLGFNHFSKECTRDLACKFCAGKHESSNCTSDVHKCVNCTYYVEHLKMKLDTNHHAYSSDCKVLDRKYNEEKKKVDRQ